ncbi:MAG: glycyl-radical enzyme activating protein [Oscillospiraceae bacterium]|jgi:pyruvate formate lyase activating enzyme|nr:glycyl-radical enzyme activating protein [Oscillospiraceae bacterium]
MIEGVVFNIQRYSIDDGPGIRTTVFLKGCPLRCPWCSNPESQSFAPQLFYRRTSCVRCGKCQASCPVGAVEPRGDGIAIDREKCVACGTCATVCAAGALAVRGEKMTAEQVWRVVRRDAVYYETSGGGVTCSGGEILSQPDFTAAIFKKCREEGIHTCADTSGFGTAEALDTVLEYADLIYFDIKHHDPRRHLELMGVSAEGIWQNLSRVARRKIPLTIRLPLIPEYNNSEDDLRATAELIQRLAPESSVSILPYHKYGESKYDAVGMQYALGGLRENTEAELRDAKAIFERYGFACEVSK